MNCTVFMNQLMKLMINKLPNSFVLKATHGSGFNIICKDKLKMNWGREF